MEGKPANGPTYQKSPVLISQYAFVIISQCVYECSGLGLVNKAGLGYFPGDPMVKTHTVNARGSGLNPGQGTRVAYRK